MTDGGVREVSLDEAFRVAFDSHPEFVEFVIAAFRDREIERRRLADRAAGVRWRDAVRGR